jgi:hypothetical protein
VQKPLMPPLRGGDFGYCAFNTMLPAPCYFFVRGAGGADCAVFI